MIIEFQNKTVAVVGAMSAMGQAIVATFAQSGATVWACDIRPAPHADPADSAGDVRALQVDATDESSVADAVRTMEAASASGAVDVLVYVAGGLLGETPTPIEQVNASSWHKVVDVNLFGAFVACRAVVTGMKKAGSGSIVVISSGAGLTTSKTGVISYCASKHAQVGLVKQLAAELAPFSINVNSVAPGFIPCSPDSKRQWDGWTPEMRETFLARVVGRRPGVPQDIANATLFLASPQAEWITGQVLPVSGTPT
jgi:3-oxoacyl-[acyl-carrier protein] reductase